jgi:N-acyl-D-amino-acid deacylase
MHDLIIKGGTIADGSGSATFTGDVAIDAGKITAVGQIDGSAKRTIDADGLLVTPGWARERAHHRRADEFGRFHYLIIPMGI